LQNDAGTSVSYWHKSDTIRTRFVLDGLTKENAATSAKVNGAKTSIETIQFPEENSLQWARAPEIILRHFCGVAA
tara:strand:+ start:3285 stop:3509 length:225 start_codon:yes stop_codon:yes gene_type:complete